MKTTSKRIARLLATAGAVLLVACSAAVMLSPVAHAERTQAAATTAAPEEDVGAGTMILGIVVFLGGGAFLAWAIWHHIKYTVKGTMDRVEVLKEAVAGAKEEIKLANERKKNGEGWTLPPDYVRKVPGQGQEEIVFFNNDGSPRQ